MNIYRINRCDAGREDSEGEQGGEMVQAGTLLWPEWNRAGTTALPLQQHLCHQPHAAAVSETQAGQGRLA